MKVQVQQMFQEGAAPTLEAVLNRREYKQKTITSLLQKYPTATLLFCSCNIPGPIKQNATIAALQQLGIDAIEEQIFVNNYEIIQKEHTVITTGPESFWILKHPPQSIKEMAIAVEELRFGRLLDLDVYYYSNDHVEQYSRTELGVAMRKCFICDDTAKNCASRRTHTLHALQTKIIEILENCKIE